MTREVAMELIRASRKKCETQAAHFIAANITRILDKQELAVLGIPGGRSVAGIFNLLKQEPIDWKRVHVFMVDERKVPITHEDSNFKLAYRGFLGFLAESGLLPEENIHPFFGSLTTYQKELLKVGGKYDIVLFSAGEDGHIGALYPNHHSIRSKKKQFLTMQDSPKPPAKRMSMSPALVRKVDVALVIFFGEGKREALNKFLDKKIGDKECPAKLVLSCPNSLVLSDLKK